ncbi:MAG: arabinose ABC transporter permease [Novosphingobium sp. 17-62-9]|nr:MAG: arabinose ABC transporter permease [Novosphingobium sp. 17-62-9]
MQTTPVQTAQGQTGQASALAPFRYPAFRAIWTANLFSNIGAMIQSVGAAWLMTELTDSHVLVALVQASATIPILLLGLFAGAIADNFDRRRVMLAAQTGMLVVSAILATLSYTGNVGPWSLLALTLMVGMGTALNGPAWQASVRLQVGRADLPQAISLNAISFNLARSVGPALGGILISLWSTSLAFALNAVSYIGMIVVLMLWRPVATPPRREPMLAAIVRGLRFCAASPPILKVLARGLLIGFGVGSILTAFRISRVRQRFGSEAVVTAATVIFAAALVLMASATSIPMAVAATFLGGMGWASTMTSLNVAMQLRSPEDILGRCLSIYQAITFGGMALGAWVWGALADATSLETALHGAAIWLIASLAMHFIAPMPTREEGRIDSVPAR